MMLTLMLTSKGVAAVPRVSMVVLIATLQSFKLPLEGAAMILGVDAFMDMARTSVNVLGNCLASVVIARWENEFDAAKAEAEFGNNAATVD
jgi:proton glutamate symport protein